MVKDPAAHEHFKFHDPVLFAFVQTVTIGRLSARPPQEYFESLCHTIIGQQLSNKVADVISSRFSKLFRGQVTPKKLLNMKDEELRGTGMSWSKVRFVKDLATHVRERTVDLVSLQARTDEDVKSHLSLVKGVGPWTVEMFLMFTLGRPDIFSFGDLGLKRAIQKLYGLKRPPSIRKMATLSRRWAPYRTYAALALWKYNDG